MKKLFWIVLLFVVLAATFLAGSWYNKPDTAKSRVSEIKQSRVTEESGNDTSSMPPGTVKITPEKQQIIGVKLGTVEKKAVTHTLRILGRVAADETRTYRILAAADGWIVETFTNPMGSLVKKDEVLASVFIPGILTEQRAYINWLLQQDLLSKTRNPLQTAVGNQRFTENLKNLGMGDLQIQEIARTRELIQTNHFCRSRQRIF